MNAQAIFASFSDVHGNRVREEITAFHIGEFLAIHRACARQASGLIVFGRGWVVAHRLTGYSCTGNFTIPDKRRALKYALKFDALPMDWNSDSVDEIKRRGKACMQQIDALKAEIRAMNEAEAA